MYTTADDGSQNGEVIYTYGGNEVGRTQILVTTEDAKQIIPDAGSAIEEIEHMSGMDGFIAQVKTLVDELGMLKSLTGLAILIAIIVVIILSIRRAHKRRKQKKILSKIKHSERKDAPVMDEIEDFDTDELTEEIDSDKPES